MSLPNLFGNDFFAGGLALGALAAAANYGWRLLLIAGAWLRRRFVTDVEIRQGELVFWFGLWLSETRYGRRCKRVAARTLYHEEDSAETLVFEPGAGGHLVWRRPAPVLVQRLREENKLDGVPRDYYALRIFGSRAAADALLTEVQETAQALLTAKRGAYISNGHEGWERVTVGVPRTLASVVLADGVVEALLADARRFLARREWYAERGIPWRRGYLLEGPPGTGKTSLARALAHDLGCPLYVLDLTGKEFSDRELIMTLSHMPTRAVLLVEDIDEQLRAEQSHITLAGLLNALDGPLSPEGRLLVVTTNSPERLDAALDRSGRIDMRLHLGHATASQARRMFLRFFPGAESEAEDFSAAVPDRTIPPAAIQNHLEAHAENIERAIAEAPELARRQIRVVQRGGAA